jgi:hypothetical protein
MLQQIISELRRGQNSIFPGSYPSFNALHDKLHDVCTWQPPLTNQKSKQTLTWKIARKQKHNGTLLTWTSRWLVVLRLNSFYCLRITLTDVTGQAWVDEPQEAYCYGANLWSINYGTGSRARSFKTVTTEVRHGTTRSSDISSTSNPHGLSPSDQY